MGDAPEHDSVPDNSSSPASGAAEYSKVPELPSQSPYPTAPAQHNASSPYSPVMYRSAQHAPFPQNFQHMQQYRATPPIPLSPYYYSYPQSPIGVPQYGFPLGLGVSRSEAYAEPARHAPRVSAVSLATTNAYPRLVYAPPGPYHYSMPPGPISVMAPAYNAPLMYPSPSVIPRMDSGSEYWYGPRHTMAPDPEVHPQSASRTPIAAGEYEDRTTPRPSPPTASESLPVPPPSKMQAPHILRRPYQPQLPANRSEWVMWVGNIPSDCTRDELSKFFETIPGSEVSVQDADGSRSSGVISVFLISQSNCAFVNYGSEASLLHAVSMCNGRALRDDPWCLKLVCRVRKKDEDLKAGVGAQRGVRMHTAWVQQQKGKGLFAAAAPQGEPPYTSVSLPVADNSSDASSPPLPQEHAKTSPTITHHDGSSGSVSFASTNSSFLATYFPQRYFILKSLTQHDLDLSVERKLWATQPHNEPILDQAYRTSKDVFLIFGANKSGEFFGYARMSGPVLKDEARAVSWASRADPSTAISDETRHLKSDGSESSSASMFNAPKAWVSLSPAEQVVLRESPLPVTPSSARPILEIQQHASTAPPEMVEPFRRISKSIPRTHADTFVEKKAVFELDRNAPIKAMRGAADHTERTDSAPPPGRSAADDDGVAKELGALSFDGNPIIERPGPSPVQSQNSSHDLKSTFATQVDNSGWGTAFPVDWIRVQPLAFSRTRHLRNPWNADREIKVSRDGTELEPDVGRQLLAEWDDLPTTPPLPASSRKINPRGGAAGRR